MFDQPELEALLRANLKRYPQRRAARRRRGHRRSPDPAATVQVTFTDRRSGDEHRVDADYVLGCDGANSLVRTAIGSHDGGLELRAALAGGRCGHRRPI